MSVFWLFFHPLLRLGFPQQHCNWRHLTCQIQVSNSPWHDFTQEVAKDPMDYGINLSMRSPILGDLMRYICLNVLENKGAGPYMALWTKIFRLQRWGDFGKVHVRRKLTNRWWTIFIKPARQEGMNTNPPNRTKPSAASRKHGSVAVTFQIRPVSTSMILGERFRSRNTSQPRQYPDQIHAFSKKT